ncbi:MAG: aldo/keto reductase [Polyangiaceae bacterium]|nr:aldo/keto reductase [Polyangiaceae bacterium]
MTDTKAMNRLARETSPYLLQHQHNPVDWFPWSEEALARARSEDRPLLLSIGYAACHWCHVMEHECFEDGEVANLMNEHFVCIKVDREERPDIDELYMAATLALNGSGGWPMTVFLTPDQRPFFAGTYFPKEDKWGRPGFKTLLSRIAELWQSDRPKLISNAEELTQHLQKAAAVARPLPIERASFDRAVQQLEASFDETWGGFGTAPKFPPSSLLSFLLQEHYRTQNPKALHMVEATLEAMSRGGMYDHLAGGFARYSTDERWFLPHFEKMLYDNALLARVYLEAFQATQNPEFARIAQETLDYVLAEMQGAEGGYFSATDADSEGEEGKYFVWAEAELKALLTTEEARVFCEYYAVRPEGNWEGKNILHTPRPRAAVAEALGLEDSEFSQLLKTARERVYAARQQRIPPLLDDKILVSWNALMISAMAEGYRVLGDARYLDSAERAQSFLFKSLRRPDGGLFRTYRLGRAHLHAYLEDYAFLGDALITLYEASGNEEHLRWATALLDRLVSDFGDDTGGAFFHTAHGEVPLVVRLREGHDSALPNANATAALALGRLGEHLDREDFSEAAKQALLAYGQSIERSPRAFASSLSALERHFTPSAQLVLAAEDRTSAEPFLRELAKLYLPNRVIGWQLQGSSLTTPLLRGKKPVAGPEPKGARAEQPALYVCQNFTCQSPLVNPKEVAAALSRGVGAPTREKPLRVPLQGFATPEQTRIYAELFTASFGPGAYEQLAGLSACRLGFGGYRVRHSDESEREALTLALKSGVNLIDTSSTYTEGSSERLVGDVLHQLVDTHELKREEIIVVSKVGYAQGEALEIVKARRQAGASFPEMVEHADDLWHSIHPTWIEEQLTASLTRLGLSTLDGYLLHNPEYYLSQAKRSGLALLSAQSEFYRRIEAAFAQLEREVSRGRLRFYGVSSNTVARPRTDAEATDVEKFYKAAVAAGGASHHFRVMEFPFNVVEHEAATRDVHNGSSVIDKARQLGLAVLTNRPLNAITEFGLLRIADIPRAPEGSPSFTEALEQLRALELEFTDRIAPGLTNPDGKMPKHLFNWAVGLKEAHGRLATRHQFLDLRRTVIEPHVGQLKLSLTKVLQGEAHQRFAVWFPRYRARLGQALGALEQLCNARSNEITADIRKKLEPRFGSMAQSLDLGQLAIATLLSQPGVCSVLVGMRRSEYVMNSLAALAGPRSAPPSQWLNDA